MYLQIHMLDMYILYIIYIVCVKYLYEICDVKKYSSNCNSFEM